MSDLLFQYKQVNPTTWAYLSSLLSLALFFKFNRFWTLRNVDLVLVILLAPALLCIKYSLDQPFAQEVERVELTGYIWLFSVNAVLLLRMLIDPAMVRRPLLESNLSAGAMTFLGVSLLLFLAANVIKGNATDADLYAAQRADYLAKLEASELENRELKRYGPGFTFLYFLPHISTQRLLGDAANQPVPVTPDSGSLEQEPQEAADTAVPAESGYVLTARVMAVLSQFLIVLGMILVATRHFENYEAGISAASLYLMLPYTAMWTGSVTHALPGALLVWAVLCYRRPLLAGILIGLLCGTIYHPVFLLPLWVTFYWRRGVRRFSIGVVGAVLALIATLAFNSTDLVMFLSRLQQIFNFQLPLQEGLAGVWRYWNPYYRVPLYALFIGLSFSFILWPAQKNLGTLLSCSAALMLGSQFLHAHGGGMSLAWCLPVMLLTIFRPNLEDRVAVDVVATSRWQKA